MTALPVDPGPVAGVAAVGSGGSRQGRYAGIVSRSVAISADAVVLAVLSIGSLFVLQAIGAMVEGKPFGDVTLPSELGVVVVVFQSAAYFTVAWAVFGRTAGEALFGLRTIRRTGGPVGWGRAFVRFLVSPLALSVCGLGFAWMLVDRRRRTWPDLVAGTVVVYDWRRADRVPVEVVTPHG